MSDRTKTIIMAAATILIFATTAAHAEALYTRTEDGTVSVNQKITAETCAAARQLALTPMIEAQKELDAWWKAAEEYKKANSSYGEMMEIEGWPKTPRSMIVEAECLK